MLHAAPGVARRIDRLSRHAHRFHRFAHHPLCDAYRGELIALGRRARVCRGCALTAAGFAVGAAIGVAGGALGTCRTGAALLAASCIAWVATAGVTLLRKRPPKLLTRALPALLAGATLGAGVRYGAVAVLVLGALLGTALAAFLTIYRRRGPDRTPCNLCPERRAARTCSGFLPIVRRERAFRRLSARWLAILSQILAARSLNRSSHNATQVLTGQAELANSEAKEARPHGHSTPNPNSDGLAVFYVAKGRQLIAICHRQDLTQ